MLLKSLKQKTHFYYFVVIYFIGVIFGICASVILNNEFFSSGWILISSFGLVALSFVKLRMIFLFLILVAGFLMGSWRASTFELQKQDYSFLFGQVITAEGVVSDDVYKGEKGDIRFKLKDFVVNDRQYNGEVWISSYQEENLRRSDTVTVKGQLKEGFGGFFATMPATEILQIEKTSSNDVGIVARDNFAGEVKQEIPESKSTLGLGFLLGQKNELPEELDNQIMLLGLSHIVVASGYNLTILVAFARRLFARISKYLSAIFGGALIGGFILITGFSPSMSRAGLVAGLSLVAWYYGRKIHPVTLLLVSAGVTLLVKPSYIWGDLGWYLSFLAFIGVLILAPLINHFFWGEKAKVSWLRELIIVTLSAQIMTLPLLLYTFGLFSPFSLLANILILPVIPFAMLLVFVTGVVAWAVPFLGGAISIFAEIILGYCIFVTQKLASLPNSLNELSIGLGHMVFLYLSLLFFIFLLKLKTKHNFLKDKSIVD